MQEVLKQGGNPDECREDDSNRERAIGKVGSDGKLERVAIDLELAATVPHRNVQIDEIMIESICDIIGFHRCEISPCLLLWSLPKNNGWTGRA